MIGQVVSSLDQDVRAKEGQKVTEETRRDHKMSEEIMTDAIVSWQNVNVYI